MLLRVLAFYFNVFILLCTFFSSVVFTLPLTKNFHQILHHIRGISVQNTLICFLVLHRHPSFPMSFLFKNSYDIHIFNAVMAFSVKIIDRFLYYCI
jgi:hypothetical protein